MLHDLYDQMHVECVAAFGVAYPFAFSTLSDEYRAMTERAALVDACHWGAIRLTGTDRARLLNALVTHDIASLDPGTGRCAALTTIKGRLVAELLILVRADELVALVVQGDTGAVASSIDKHVVADDVAWADASAQTGVLAVEGPMAREIARRIFPDGPLPAKPGTFADLDYQGISVTLVRESIAGDGGYLFVVPRAGLSRIRGYIVQAGRAIDLAPAGLGAWNARRVENGIPWWGADVTEERFPKEVRLDHLVSYDKGCYLGQETLARMHHRGHPNWLLVGAAPEGPVVAPPPPQSRSASAPRGTATLAGSHARVGSTVLAPSAAGEPVVAGRITSAIASPRLGTPLFLALVRREHAEPGTRLSLEGDSDAPELVVRELPLR